MDFNLQQYLTEMRREARDDFKTVRSDISDVRNDIGDVKDTLHKHDKRIMAVENMRRVLIFAGGSLIVGTIGFLFDMVKNHLFKGVGQ